MDEKCILDPGRDCLGIKRADEVAVDVKALDRRLSDFQEAVAKTNTRFGERIGNLEGFAKVADVNFDHLKTKISEIAKDMAVYQTEQKDSIRELRKEHKDSMDELKRGNKEILEMVTPLRHKAEEIEKLAEDVEALEEKPGKRWDSIVGQVIGLVVAALVGFLLSRLGISG